MEDLFRGRDRVSVAAPRRLRLSGGLAVALLLGSTVAATTAHAQTVRLITSAGEVVLALDPAKSPKTVANFLGYVKAGHYEGTVFHRVIPGFMIQGGGYTADLQEKPTGAPIPLESRNGLSNKRGTIAMARTPDPDSARAQFFINVADNRPLDFSMGPGREGYAVFGRVIKGMEVVDRIVQSPRGPRGPFPSDVPQSPIVIKQAIVEK